LSGDSLSLVKFEQRAGKVESIDVDGDGVLEYMNRGGGWQPVTLISSAGATLWRREGAPDDMAAIDLNGDDTLEFVVGFNAGGGLKALDVRGNELWSRSASNVFSVAAVDVDEDGSDEIVHTDGDPTLIREADGRIIRKFQRSLYRFAVCPWSDDKHSQVLLRLDDSAIVAINFDGSRLGSYSIPRGGVAVAATPITFGQSEFFAVVVQGRATTHLSTLYVFDERDSLVYHELFHGQTPSVAVIPTGEESGDALLVGAADGVVAKYNWKGTPGS
jgi:hypothetical protein